MSAFDSLLATVAARFDVLDTDAPAAAHDARVCPPATLGHLAWSRSLDHWSSSWPEATKRDLIRHAPAVARLRGTRAAIDTVAGVFGSLVEIDEWWEQLPLGEPGTARASVSAAGVVGQVPLAQDELRVLLVREGRASVHWDVRVTGSALAQLRTRGVLRAVVLHQLEGVQRGA